MKRFQPLRSRTYMGARTKALTIIVTVTCLYLLIWYTFWR